MCKSCNVCMLGIILWLHNNLKIYSPITACIHLWRHSLTSATLFLAYIKFYHAISHVVIANQKREILEEFSLINLLVDLCRIHTKTTCSFSCNQVTSFQCEAKQIIYMIGFPPTTLTCNHLKIMLMDKMFWYEINYAHELKCIISGKSKSCLSVINFKTEISIQLVHQSQGLLLKCLIQEVNPKCK